MKRLLYLLLSVSLSGACTTLEGTDPYGNDLHTLDVRVVYPEQFAEHLREGLDVQIEEIDRGNTYLARTDAEGRASIRLTNGIYRIKVSDRADADIFNGTADKVQLVGRDLSFELPLTHSRAGTLLIKEIYCGGCMKTPQEGKYQSDKYIIVHNNDSQTQYLDSLCFGTLDPYNSQGTNVWVERDPETGASMFPDFVPIVQVVWQFGGNGRSFPLAPGEDAVICCCGAIDHAAQYPLSVNLNKPGYFTCYDPMYFPNTHYHPAPGDRIATDRYLNVVIKLGQANAFTFSIFSPATVLFRTPGTTIQQFIEASGNVIQKPGSKVDRIVKIPCEWVIDGVEVFYGGSSNNKKRFSPQIDAGYVTQSDIYLGRSMHRRIDEAASAEAGFEKLCDTNDSSADFYERNQASLHE